MIQIIKYNTRNNVNDNNITFNDFKNYESFDLYDINIVSLNDCNIWYNNPSHVNDINCANDICKIAKSIQTCKNSKILVLFPQNYDFYYSHSSYSKIYQSHIEIKTISNTIQEMMASYIHPFFPIFEYEKGTFKSNGITYNFDFYFENISESYAVIKADKSDKVVAVKYDNVIISSLLIDFNKDYGYELMELLHKLYGYGEKFCPKWINDIYFNNDKKLIESNTKLENKISVLNEKISENNLEISKNNYYKGVLYETGDELQKIVIDILESILNKHSDFEDVSEEDYLFKDGDYTFIVETKGLNNEVRGENVSAAFSHLTIYEDKLDEQGIVENTKCLFIVASERKTEPSKRKKVNDRQIKLAEKNNTLIIDTPSLLDIYNDFLLKKIKKEEIIDLFVSQYGLIDYKKRGK